MSTAHDSAQSQEQQRCAQQRCVFALRAETACNMKRSRAMSRRCNAAHASASRARRVRGRMKVYVRRCLSAVARKVAPCAGEEFTVARRVIAGPPPSLYTFFFLLIIVTPPRVTCLCCRLDYRPPRFTFGACLRAEAAATRVLRRGDAVRSCVALRRIQNTIRACFRRDARRSRACYVCAPRVRYDSAPVLFYVTTPLITSLMKAYCYYECERILATPVAARRSLSLPEAEVAR